MKFPLRSTPRSLAKDAMVRDIDCDVDRHEEAPMKGRGEPKKGQEKKKGKSIKEKRKAKREKKAGN